VRGSAKSYEGLMASAQKHETDWWSCGKNTKNDDLLFFYFKKPKSEIVALATASGDAKPNREYRYGVHIKNVERIGPISLEKIRETFPKWGWLKRTRNLTYLDDRKRKKLLKLAGLSRRPAMESLITISSTGAGFGTPKQNREVERVACQNVRTYFERLGYHVQSREKEKIGYDFDVRKKEEELHVEVKGISGSALRFPITTSEVKCAKSDARFCLVVVIRAMSDKKEVQVFTRADFLKRLNLRPLAYFAEAKSGFFA
jgi:hypothetical protein